MRSGRYDPVELDALKARRTLSDLFFELGFPSKGSAKERFCSCPFHLEKTPSCKINDGRMAYYCHGCGESGDHYSLLMFATGCTFIEAVERLGGVRPVSAEERSELANRRQQIAAEEERERQEQRSWIERAWARFDPIEGTPAADYLAGRGIPASPNWTFDLRFAKALGYKGFESEGAHAVTLLGEFPAMVAAIRDGARQLIGLHRTYFNLKAPEKLVPPGDVRRNRSKKILGEARGGLIWLSEPGATVVVGEGIETTRSWPLLERFSERQDALAAAVSLGNMSGRCTGSIPHPDNIKKRIPNGMPDLDEPWIIWPESVREITWLMDGDSDQAMTRQRILCALRRTAHLGIQGFVSAAPSGSDWNDVRRQEAA